MELLQEIKSKLVEHDGKFDRAFGDIAELKADVGVLKRDVAELKGDVAELKGDVAELKGDVSGLKTGQHRLELLFEDNTRTLNVVLDVVMDMRTRMLTREDIQPLLDNHERRISALEDHARRS